MTKQIPLNTLLIISFFFSFGLTAKAGNTKLIVESFDYGHCTDFTAKEKLNDWMNFIFINYPNKFPSNEAIDRAHLEIFKDRMNDKYVFMQGKLSCEGKPKRITLYLQPYPLCAYAQGQNIQSVSISTTDSFSALSQDLPWFLNNPSFDWINNTDYVVFNTMLSQSNLDNHVTSTEQQEKTSNNCSFDNLTHLVNLKPPPPVTNFDFPFFTLNQEDIDNINNKKVCHPARLYLQLNKKPIKLAGQLNQDIISFGWISEANTFEAYKTSLNNKITEYSLLASNEHRQIIRLPATLDTKSLGQGKCMIKVLPGKANQNRLSRILQNKLILPHGLLGVGPEKKKVGK